MIELIILAIVGVVIYAFYDMGKTRGRIEEKLKGGGGRSDIN